MRVEPLQVLVPAAASAVDGHHDDCCKTRSKREADKTHEEGNGVEEDWGLHRRTLCLPDAALVSERLDFVDFRCSP